MGRSIKSLECGLGHEEKDTLEAAYMVSRREDGSVEKGPEHHRPSLHRSQDARMQSRRPLEKFPLFLGLVLIVFILTTLRYAPVIPTCFKGRICTQSKMCNFDRDWRDLLAFHLKSRPEDIASGPRTLHEIPQYVLDYAPLVHLYSEEQFWPCDIKEHLFHVTPELNYTPIQGLPQLNLTNLDLLNQFEEGRHVFLTSNDNVEDRPEWLGGQINIPDDFTNDAKADHLESQPARGQTPKQSHGGHSDAPAVLLTIDKGDGIVDAFWFFFYSYNLGNLVFNIRFGNHIGDWEHTLIRFEHGKPKVVFVSEHFFGSAYSYSAVEKIGNRVSMECL